MCFGFEGVLFKADKLALAFNGVWVQKAYHMQASHTSCEIVHPIVQACIGL